MSLAGTLFGGTGLTNPRWGVNAAQRGYNQETNAIKAGSQNLQNYTGQANDAITAGKTQALDFLNQGVNQASPYYQQAASLYGGLAPGDLSARAMYLNSLGLNGPEGNTAATNAFQNSPGFQFALDQANQNVLRNGAATGNVASGNVLQALADRAQGLQNQDYGNWQSQLSNQGNNIYNDYSGQANALGALAGLFGNLGSNQANVATGAASQIAGNLTGLGSDLNANNLNLGRAAYQRAQDIFGAQTSAAQNQVNQNMAIWNGLLGLAGTGLDAAGKAGGFGNLMSMAAV